MAEIPNFTRSQARNRELVAHTRPQSRAADAFRAIKTSLLFQQSGYQEHADFQVQGSVADTIAQQRGVAIRAAADDIARTVVSLAVNRF